MSTWDELSRGVRAVIYAIFVFFGANILAYVVYRCLPAEPCQYGPGTCRVFVNGWQYRDFESFFGSLSVSVVWGLGVLGGAIGGFIRS